MAYYGHGSWIALVVFGGVLLIRVLTSQRRRGGSPGGRPPGSSFTSSRTGMPPRPPVAPPDGTPPETRATGHPAARGVAPGWFTDPTGRHEQRYWSGTDWSEHVVDQGVPGTDPPPPSPRRPSAPDGA